METEENDNDEEEDAINNCFNLLQIELFENELIKLIPKLLGLQQTSVVDSMEVEGENNSCSKLNLVLCEKYLKFLIKYLNLKQVSAIFYLFSISHNRPGFFIIHLLTGFIK